MRFKILSLLFVLGILMFCGEAKAQITPPAACTSIATDIASGNFSQAESDVVACAGNIAGVVATPLCQAGCPNGGSDCTSPCQPLCTGTYGAHNVACCLEALAAAKVTIPSAVNTVLGTICGPFASTLTLPIVNKQWCYGIPHAAAQQALPLIGVICCNYYSLISDPTDAANINTCLGTTTPALTCAQYAPSNVCSSTSMGQDQKKEKDKE